MTGSQWSCDKTRSGGRGIVLKYHSSEAALNAFATEVPISIELVKSIVCIHNYTNYSRFYVDFLESGRK